MAFWVAGATCAVTLKRSLSVRSLTTKLGVPYRSYFCCLVIDTPSILTTSSKLVFAQDGTVVVANRTAILRYKQYPGLLVFCLYPSTTPLLYLSRFSLCISVSFYHKLICYRPTIC